MIFSEKDASLEEVNILVVQGNNDLQIQLFLRAITQEQLPGFAELNISRIDGTVSGFSDISMQTNMLPLGTGKRVVIIDDAFELLKKKGGKEWFRTTLSNFPPTTLLVLLLVDEKKWSSRTRDYEWSRFKKEHWILKSLQEYSGRCLIKQFPLPTVKEMPNWIIDKAKELGGGFHPAAAQTLMKLVGNNLFQAEQEIKKAISYVENGNQVTSADVRLLCASSKEESIFTLIDSVGQRDGKQVFKLMQEMSMTVPKEQILSMVIRQFRQLLLTKVILASGGNNSTIRTACGLKGDWLAKKLINQARHFTMSELMKIYRQLDHIDEDYKIGHVSLSAALDSLLASISLKS